VEQHGSTGADGPPSPLDPSWTPAPQLQPTDALELAQPTFAFSAPAAEAPVAAPAFFPPPAPVEPQPLAPPVAVAPAVAPAVEPMPAPPVEPMPAPPVAASPVAPLAPPAAPQPVAVTPVPAEPMPAPPVAAQELSALAAVLPEEPQAAEAAPAEPAAVRIGAEDTSDDSGFLTDLLLEVLNRGCSDLHLTVGAPPTVRQNGSLTPLEDRAKLTPQFLQKLIYAILSQKQREKFEEVLELDFAYSVPGRARFRVNVYRQRDAIGAAFRLIPYEIKALEDLGVPPTVANFAMLPRGFVLVTGPTGSGKSTTLAAVIDLANRQRRDHIMSVEDPIEFLHEHKSCLVNQREVGEDTHSFKNALKHVLRQDPDIILVGEMRDLETIEIALTAAETGHLVMATLHTQDAAQTIDRVIDVFPPHQQQQVRTQLAGAIQGVVCQQLVKTADGKGRVVATEVLVATPAIRNLIREGKTHQIYSAMQAGAKHGMATMDQHLAELVKKGKITYDAALEKCHHVEDFTRLCGRA
jgi:twitching motility protein PilT